MNNLYQETKFIMKKYGISANKSLGQNFLVDEDVVNTIADSASITKEDLVIEIGPGLGTLTAKLLDKAKNVVSYGGQHSLVVVRHVPHAYYGDFTNETYFHCFMCSSNPSHVFFLCLQSCRSASPRHRRPDYREQGDVAA